MSISSVLLVLFTSLADTRSIAPTPSVLVDIRVPNGPFYVGQEILLQVDIEGGTGHPQITVPKLANADLAQLPTELDSTSSLSSDHNRSRVVSDRVALRLTPRQPGTLRIPPLSFRSGERTARSRAIRLNVAEVPSTGRPAEFLGGVGPFTLNAGVEPSRLLLGQTFEYRIEVKGPGARGMIRQPVLKRFENQSLGLRVQALPVEFAEDQASRIFRYRVRAQRSGEFRLPPVSLASFDPISHRFITKATPGLRVTVRDVPKLDPNTLDYRLPEETVRRGISWMILIPVTLGILFIGILWPRVRRTLVAKRNDRALRRLTTSIRGRITKASDPSEAARFISEGLIEYLNRTTGRPTGALTPPEAREGIAQLGEDRSFEKRAEEIVARCDRALFAGDGAELNGLVSTALAFFQDLDRRRKPGKGKNQEAQMPREADGTAAS